MSEATFIPLASYRKYPESEMKGVHFTCACDTVQANELEEETSRRFF